MSAGTFTTKAKAPHMTFDTFVACEENLAAVQIAILMAEKGHLSRGEGPLYLYGDAGVGKTHILTAIGHAASDLSCAMFDTASLKQECERAWELGENVDLKERLIDPDMLLLDDIHLSSDHEQFQNEIFAIIELRVNAGLTVVMTSTGPPASLRGLEAGTEAIVKSGHIERIQMGGADAKVEILKSFLDDHRVPEDELYKLLEGESDNGHSLKRLAEGLRGKLEARQLLQMLGYQVYRTHRGYLRDMMYVISRWSNSVGGRAHVVEITCYPEVDRLYSRAWCPWP